MGDSKPHNTKTRIKEIIHWAVIGLLIAIFFVIVVIIIFILAHTAFDSSDIYAIVTLCGILFALYFAISRFSKSEW
jgi:uncharacterized membrane protein YhaH (DUF805 family)